MLYTEITASNLIKIDLDGTIVDRSELDLGVNRAGFVIHSAIHAARPDAHCVMHTHTRAGMALSALKCGLLPLTQTATRFDKVAYHDFEGIAVDLAERESLVSDLGDAEVMVLRNDGLVALGASVPECFNTMYRLELACKVQVDAMACNTELVMPPEHVVRLAESQWKPGVTRRGVIEWPAMLRQLEHIDPTYKD